MSCIYVQNMQTCSEGAGVCQVHGDLAAQQDVDLLGVRVALAEQRCAFIKDLQLALPQHLQREAQGLMFRLCRAPYLIRGFFWAEHLSARIAPSEQRLIVIEDLQMPLAAAPAPQSQSSHAGPTPGACPICP